MISRVTNQTLAQSAQRNLQSGMAKLAKLQDQASTQKAITKPSDDPAAAADALRIRAEQRAADQYGRNIDNGTGWLTTLDGALATATDLMQRVRDLAARGANGSLNATAKEAIAVEIEGLKKDLAAQANTTYLGRTVFAGTSDAGAAFQPDGTFNGNGTAVDRRIGPNSTVRVDADGAEVFGTAADGDSVFALLDKIAADLRDPAANVGTNLAAIDQRLDAIISAHAGVGVRHALLQQAEEANLDQKIALEAQRSGVEDVDLSKVILDLKLQEVSYQSALAVTARVLQPTLMDFLR
ncbi:flagellar hook-associated protein FlgL [Arthrobacter sp. I2-34]|uniref:Flagellar hook-associated protein FlgL n=1 Tax=Arthrobacter hankyongi TaxID=2904801 RepID=A0ABS9L4L1_9MICC|nr:flagellar hook-associated protein FlgL [Arthrobacter hankyongi]MCG2621619.1 flagellar hook-associated protein FlgL [Arthrobacter hankyongi]